MKQAETAASMKKLLFQVYQLQLHEEFSGNFPLGFIIKFNSIHEYFVLTKTV